MMIMIQARIRCLAVGIFVIMSVTPPASVAVHWLWPSLPQSIVPLTEPVELPREFTLDFPSKFEQWFTDRIRRSLPLLAVNADYQVGLLHRSSDPRIVLARAGWLFWTDTGDTTPATMANFRGKLRFTDAEVEERQRQLLRMHDELMACNIQSLVAVVPNKQTIYGEELSGGGPTEQTELDDLLSRLDPRARSLVLDLRQPLRVAKARHPDLPLYYRTDSHWNMLGALYGYSAIMEALARKTSVTNLPLASRDRYRIKLVPHPPGDLAQILSASPWFADVDVETRPIFDVAPPPAAGQLFIIGDSFARALMPYFRPHFSSVEFERFSIPPTLAKPAVVLLELTERYLIVLTWPFEWSRFCAR